MCPQAGLGGVTLITAKSIRFKNICVLAARIQIIAVNSLPLGFIHVSYDVNVVQNRSVLGFPGLGECQLDFIWLLQRFNELISFIPFRNLFEFSFLLS